MESDIHNWILNKLSVEDKAFSGMPACPFAKTALLDNKVKCIELKNIFDHISMADYLLAELENYTYHWPKDIDVIVLGCDPKLISAEKLSEITEHANNTFIGERGYLVLEDHPDHIESVDGFVVNQGNWALLLLQSRDKIITARKILDRRGYYKNWDADYYKEVVLDRT